MSRRIKAQRPGCRRAARPRLELLEGRLAPAVFEVASAARLAAAIEAANTNDDLVNAIILQQGTYQLVNALVTDASEVAASKTLTIYGFGSTITAGEAGRVLEVVDASIVLEDLTITGGRVLGQSAEEPARGGGLLVVDGNATLRGVTVTNNVVRGSDGSKGGDAYGGGICVVDGTLKLTWSEMAGHASYVTGNVAEGGNGGAGGAVGGAGGDAMGGGIYGGFWIDRSTVSGNSATGGNGGTGSQGIGGVGGSGLGGGVFGDGFVGSSYISKNTAWGGQGGSGLTEGVGGNASGGGIWGGVESIGTAFTANGATGGRGSAGGSARGGGVGGAFVNMTSSILAGNKATGGPGGSGGNAWGGGIHVTWGPGASLFDVKVYDCEALGGSATAGYGGGGGGGAVYADVAPVRIIGGVYQGNAAVGGQGGGGGEGGSGIGGALYGDHGSPISVTGADFYANLALGGDGGDGRSDAREGWGGHGGIGYGGTIYGRSVGLYNSGVEGSIARGGNGGHGIGDGGGGYGGFGIGGAVYADYFSGLGSEVSGWAVGGSGGTGSPAGDPGSGIDPVVTEWSLPLELPAPTTLLASFVPDPSYTGMQTYLATQAYPIATWAPKGKDDQGDPIWEYGGDAPLSVFVVAVGDDGTIAPTFSGSVTARVFERRENGEEVDVTEAMGGPWTEQSSYGWAVLTDVRFARGGEFRLQLGTVSGGALTPVSKAISVSGYTPAQVRGAYRFDRIAPFSETAKADGSGQTIAIVAAYHNPNLLSDVDEFNRQFRLTANGPTLYAEYGPASSFVTFVNQAGLPGPLPGPGDVAKAHFEIALDVQWAHAIAPGAQIYVVEADSSSPDDVMAAALAAAKLPGVSVVSISIGSLEKGPFDTLPAHQVTGSDVARYDPIFNEPGVIFVAASGDFGVLDPRYPAFSPNVVAVGGTTLGYSAWPGSGGGFSRFIPQPTFQSLVRPGDEYRAIPDVSFLGSLYEGGAMVYNSYGKEAEESFWEVGYGTSLGAPAWAGLFAIVNQGRDLVGAPPLNSAEALRAMYQIAHTFPNRILVDITTVDNGGYAAVPGYDLVTGLGTPSGPSLVADLVNWGPVLSPEALPESTVGVLYEVGIVAKRGIGYKAMTYEITSGVVPAGLTFLEYPDELILVGQATEAGTFSFDVTATDEVGESVTRSYTVTINPAIYLTPGTLPLGSIGAQYRQTVRALGGTGEKALTYSVVAGPIPGGLSITVNGNELVVSGTPTESGLAYFNVVATDAAGALTNQAYALIVNQAIRIEPASLPQGTVGKSYKSLVWANGGTGELTLSPEITSGALPEGLSFLAAPYQLFLSGTPTEAGAVGFTVTATDVNGASASRSYTVVINAAISLSPGALPPALVGVAYGQAIVAEGGTGDKEMRFTVTAGAIPDGLIFVPTPNELLIAGVPTEIGAVAFTVTATDKARAVAVKDYVLQVNLALVGLTPASIPAGTAGANYFQVITASGGIGDKSMTVVVTGAIPAGMTLEAVYNSVTLAGVPTEAASMPFTVIATDAVGTWASQDYTLTVNPALAITTAWLPDWTVWKDGYHATIETAGGTAPVRFAVTEGSLPNGLTLHTSTGLIDGTPDDSGTFGFTVAATDAAGATASRDYTVYIKPRVNFASKGLPDWTAGAAGYYGDASATGGTGPLVYTLTAGALPPGLRLDETAGVLTGTPAAAGAFDFTLTATDSVGASGTKDYAVVINPAVTLAPGAVAPAAAGVAYEQAISAGGGTGLKALRYAVTAGALPAGLAIVVAGERLTLGGTPLEGGAFTFEVTATDTVGASLTRAYSLSVNGRPVLAPVADLFVDEGQTLTRTLSAADDPAQKLTFALVSGPAGLAVDADTGALSWATTDGPLTAPVTVRVTDDAAVPLSDVVTFTVTVRNVAPSATFAAPATAAVGAPATFRFTAPADVPADLDAGLWYSFDLDGDGTFEVANSALPDAAFTYLAPGSYTARGRVADKDGDYSEYSALVIAEAVAPAPTVVGVVVNDGGGQRSMVTSLTVTFSERVSFAGDPRAAFLLRRAGGASVELAVALTVLDGKTVAVLTFTGDDVVAGSLADGRYELTVVADQVVGAGGGRLGQDRKESVARYFGDLNGDGTVDLAELGVARSRLGSQRGDANYLWYLDYNNDGRIDSADYGEVRRRYGRGL